jgi:hypothetical protein
MSEAGPALSVRSIQRNGGEHGSESTSSLGALRRAIYETCLAPNCAYTDPLVQANGWDELLAYMLDFHRQLPGAHFVTEQFIEHHQRSIARWKMMNVDAIAIGDGVSYAEYDLQGRLVAMTGFFEAPKG